jgi:hypothetical protein
MMCVIIPSHQNPLAKIPYLPKSIQPKSKSRTIEVISIVDHEKKILVTAQDFDDESYEF